MSGFRTEQAARRRRKVLYASVAHGMAGGLVISGPGYRRVCWWGGNGVGQTVRFQEILRRRAIIDESCMEDQAGLGLALPESGPLDAKTAALARVWVLVAIGSPAVCLEWGTTRAPAAAAPAAGLSRVVGVAPDVAAALGYDVETALLEDLDDH